MMIVIAMMIMMIRMMVVMIILMIMLMPIGSSQIAEKITQHFPADARLMEIFTWSGRGWFRLQRDFLSFQ